MNRTNSIISLLVNEYGEFKPQKNDPLETLVRAILSQNTSDTNSNRAFTKLTEEYGIRELSEVSENVISQLISVGGLHDLKAERIKKAVRFWEEKSMDEMIEEMSDDEVREELVKINGVGPKTAEIVLLFGLGRSALPVDTHVYRVSKRLELVPEKANREKTAEILREKIPQDEWVNLHLGLISHGRQVCTARNPDCEECMLLDYCPYGKGLVKE